MFFGKKKRKKKAKMTNWSHGYKGYSSFYNIDILNFLNPELQLNTNKAGILEGSFFCGKGQFDLPFIFLKEIMSI